MKPRERREALAALAAADAAFLHTVDELLAAGRERAGGAVACRIGCTECCTGLFDITALDAFRLRRGLAALAQDDGDAARGVVRRAQRQWLELRDTFPGDCDSGVLWEDEAAREEFFARHATLPCPALEPRTGQCLLYASRPLSCRSFGLPIRCGGELLPPCRLNLVGVPAEELPALAVDPDPTCREGELLGRLAALGGGCGDTIVAAALAPGRRRAARVCTRRRGRLTTPLPAAPRRGRLR